MPYRVRPYGRPTRLLLVHRFGQDPDDVGYGAAGRPRWRLACVGYADPDSDDGVADVAEALVNGGGALQLDLNLLTALDALLEEGSVLGAAERLRLSPPATSRTLGRIRRATGDQILVRTGRTMTPTPYALRVRADVHRLVQEAQALLSPDGDLDLSTLDRTFTLQFHDAVTAAIRPALLADVRARAPGVRLRFLAEASADTNDLRHGQVDVEIGASEPALPEIRGEVYAHDRLAVAVPTGDPREALTLADYAAADHVIVS